MSESRIRVPYPSHVSESRIRVPCPSPVSESRIGVTYPGPVSESRIRVTCLNPVSESRVPVQAVVPACSDSPGPPCAAAAGRFLADCPRRRRRRPSRERAAGGEISVPPRAPFSELCPPPPVDIRTREGPYITVYFFMVEVYGEVQKYADN